MEGGRVGPRPLGREARSSANGLLFAGEGGREKTPESGATLWAMQAWSALVTLR